MTKGGNRKGAGRPRKPKKKLIRVEAESFDKARGKYPDNIMRLIDDFIKSLTLE